MNKQKQQDKERELALSANLVQIKAEWPPPWYGGDIEGWCEKEIELAEKEEALRKIREVIGGR